MDVASPGADLQLCARVRRIMRVGIAGGGGAIPAGISRFISRSGDLRDAATNKGNVEGVV